ncbi:MAG: hypothetical protein MI702_10695, partial [Chlorobiales bacterium]|nr:hypothetical protein [Chlorobiales bacterium]
APDHDINLEEKEIRTMSAYPWPGNVRELRNIIERAILLRQGRKIYPSALLRSGNGCSHSFRSPRIDTPIMTLREMEADHIRRSLTSLKGNHTHTAKALGISRSTLMRKIKTLQLHGS